MHTIFFFTYIIYSNIHKIFNFNIIYFSNAYTNKLQYKIKQINYILFKIYYI